MNNRRFVVAAPTRWDGDNNARVLADHGILKFNALGTRRGAAGISPDLSRLNPLIGLFSYVAAQLVSTTRAESFRFRLLPWFDRWVLNQLSPGDHIVSSYGFANACFEYARRTGGTTFLSAGNSHPEQYWHLMEEEHRRWGCSEPPMARHWYRRSVEMMQHVDYVLTPSRHVSKSFLDRGFRRDQLLQNVYPVDLSTFTPRRRRTHGAPLRIISTGSLSLRKGTPYLLEAFRIVRQHVRDAELLLTDTVMDNALPILKNFDDLPINWAPPLPHPLLAQRLRSADIYVLPSLEEGLARTVAEALACGLPAIITENTGLDEWIKSATNGTVVPIRDPQSIANAVLHWWERLNEGSFVPECLLDPAVFSLEAFATTFLSHLERLNLSLDR